MAKFTSEKYPNLLVVGAGQFKNGELDVTGDKAKKVKAVAKRFGITEAKSGPGRPANVSADKGKPDQKADSDKA